MMSPTRKHEVSEGNTDPGEITRANAAIRERIVKANRVILVSHVRPDGDAVGSLLGLGLAIMETGKPVRMVLADGVPSAFHHLEGSRLVERNNLAGQIETDDLVIVMDASDLLRTGGVLADRIPDVNIDHHVTNTRFATINLIVPEQAATSAIIAQNLPEWGLKFNQTIASALLTGIITDTIGYRTSNMTPDIFRLSAMLMELGADLPELYTRALVNKTFEAARYWGQGLEKLNQEILPGGGVLVWSKLTLADRAISGYTGNDDADLVNFLSAIENDLAVLIIEQKNGHVKISWRARPGIDVSNIALQFGGGGHAAAAGADIPGALESVQEQVLAATRKMLTSYYAGGDHPA